LKIYVQRIIVDYKPTTMMSHYVYIHSGLVCAPGGRATLTTA